MRFRLSGARVMCALAFAFCAGCTSLPEIGALQASVGCSFDQQPSQAACQSLTTAALCAGSQWNLNECKGTQCGKIVIGTPPNPHWRFCGDGSTFSQSGGFDATAFDWTGAANLPGEDASPPAIGTVGPVGPIAAAVSAAASGPSISIASKQAQAQDAVTITEYSLPVSDMQPGPIVVAGQRMMFSAVGACGANCNNSGVFSIDTAGKVALVEALCTTPFYACRITGIVTLPDGGYCYSAARIGADFGQNLVTCVTAAGSRTLHYLHAMDGFLAGLALGFDGKIWYADAQLNAIGRLTANDNTTVQATYLPSTANLGLSSIATGPDQAMWFTATYGNQIGRIDASGYALTQLPAADSRPAGIIPGPDGNLWFAEFNANKIGRITPQGAMTEFVLPTSNAGPVGIAPGPDGALWFTELNANKIGRITILGEISEYAVPTANAQPAGIVAGPDGNMWFTEFNGNKVGKVTVPALPQVVEFFNTNLNNYFITGNAAEQSAIDNGSAGPGWSRTGAAFASGGGVAVCRFYGSLSPGPNSHFYTADANECATLKQIQATTPATQKRWNFESNDFLTTPATNGACLAGLVPIYRAYNNGFTRGIDSNHRITPSASAIADVVQRGWVSEGVVMCALQ
jgi:streptogramin lyase